MVENLLICCYQVTKFFQHEVRLRHCVFCKEPLSFWFASRPRNFDLLGREYKYYASLILMTLFVGRSESESREMCAGAGTSVSSRSSVNSFNHSGRCRKRSSESRLPSLFLFCFLFCFFGVFRTSYLSQSVTSLLGWTC